MGDKARSKEKSKRRRVRWPTRLLLALCAAALLFLFGFVWVYYARNDAALARYIMEDKNPKIRGRLEIGKIHWGPRALVDLAMKVPTPVEAEHFAVYDPSGKRVLYARRAKGEVELYPLLFGGGHLVVHHIEASNVECLVAQMGTEPGKMRVGFLEAFASTQPRSGRGARVELRDFSLQRSQVRLRFSGWSMDLDQLATKGTFIHSGGNPAEEGLVIAHHTRVPKGTLTVGDVSLPLRDAVVRRLGGLERDPTLMEVDLAGTLAGSRVEVKGKLEHVYRGAAMVDLAVNSADAQPLLAHVLGPDLLTGKGTRVTGSLQGPVGRPTIQGQLRGVTLGSGATRLDDLQGQLLLDLRQQVLLARGVKGKLLGGRIEARGDLDLSTGDWNGTAALAGVDPGRLEPVLAGELNGSVSLKGGVRPLRRGLAVLRLKLRRSSKDLLPRDIDVNGSVHLGAEIVDLAGVVLKGDGNTLTARGSVNLRRKQMNVYLGLQMPRLDGWLARRGLPAAARSLTSQLHLFGALPALRATGELSAEGVGYGPIRLQRAKAEVDLTEGTLVLRHIRSEGFGGKLDGEASIQLLDRNLRARPVPLVQARLRASGLDLTALGLSPYVIGRVFAEAQLSGPLNELSGTANVRVPRATVQGDRYEKSSARLGLLKDRVSIYQASVSRADGGRVSFWGDVFYDGRVDLRTRVHSFPVLGIPALASVPLGLGGSISGEVNVTGSLTDPRPEGSITLEDAKLRGVKLGSGRLTLTPGPDAVRLAGRFFGRLLELEGHLMTQPRPLIHLNIDLNKVPLEKLVYEVRELGDVRGLVSGRVRLDLDAQRGLVWADAKFPTLRVFLRYRPPGQRRVRLVNLVNKEDLLARFDGRQLHLVTAKLLTTVEGQASQRAEFTVGGWLSAETERADMRMRGKIAVELLEFFLAKRVKKLQGDATADVRLTGSLGKPVLEGGLWLHKVRVWMPKFDRPIEIPKGNIRLVPGALKLSGLGIRVGREQVVASGVVELSRFEPTMLRLALAGEVNFELLELLLPEEISNASGSAKIKLSLEGPVLDPQLSGQLVVKRIEISPRGWGRMIVLKGGSVAFSNYLVKTLTPLTGTYDEGMLRLSGSLRLDRWDLADIDLRIVGTGIPQRQPNVYTAELNLNLSLVGDSRRLELGGNVDLVDVRYIRKFELIRRAFIKPRVYEEEDPFWKGSPLLENLKLALMVRSTGQMVVKNEYAQLSLSGAFNVGGSLAMPRIGGQVRVEEGTFRIPFLRGEYTIRRGDIVFDRQREVDEAELSITGETLFMDRSGVDYQVKLTLEGPLNHIGIQLSSNPPLEQGQIWALLTTGRTTQQLRADLKAAVDSGGGGNQAAGAADAQVKQLTGEILGQIMVDPLKKVTRLDLLRFEMGTESAQVKAGKRLGRFINLAGEAEVGLLGDSRAEGRLEFKMHDLLMLVGKLERLSTRLETEDVDPSRGRIELKVRLPLR
jgi:hypothetical protein